MDIFQVHDAYIELAKPLVESDPQAAIDVYIRFPLKPVNEQTFNDAFITGEIVHIPWLIICLHTQKSWVSESLFIARKIKNI